nr:translation initiation factor IF-2-like [Aegilops tauschii subsp. strangulata]
MLVQPTPPRSASAASEPPSESPQAPDPDHHQQPKGRRAAGCRPRHRRRRCRRRREARARSSSRPTLDFFADLLSDGELQRCLSISGELGVYVAGTAAGPPPLSDSTAGHLSPAVVDHLPAGATRLHLHASARKPSTTEPVPTHLHLHAGATHLHLHTSASRQRARRSKKPPDDLLGASATPRAPQQTALAPNGTTKPVVPLSHGCPKPDDGFNQLTGVQRSSSNSSTGRIRRGEAARAGSEEEQQHGQGRGSSSSSTGRSPPASSWSTRLSRQAPATPVGDRGGARAGAPGGCAGARERTHAGAPGGCAGAPGGKRAASRKTWQEIPAKPAGSGRRPRRRRFGLRRQRR